MKPLTKEKKEAYALKVREATEIADMTGLDMVTRRQLIPHIFSLIASPLYYVRKENPEVTQGIGTEAEEKEKEKVKLDIIGADRKEEKESGASPIGIEAFRDELIAKGWRQSKNPDVMYYPDADNKETRFINVIDKREWVTKWKEE